METYLVIVLFTANFIGLSSQEVCNGCDCTISEDFDGPPGVRYSKLTCHEGSVTWYNPVGALRLELSPTLTKAFRFCFVMETGNAMIKVSKESDDAINTKSPPQRSQYILNDSNLKTIVTASGASKEYCMTSEEPIVLYIEPELTEHLGYQKVFFQYDITPLSEVKEPSIEDCRPCSDAEILRAFCSSDFVIVGSMDSVENVEDSDKTHIEVAVSQIIRQRGSHFHRHRRDSSTLQGLIVTHKKCGVVRGDGLFLMTGKIRFGELKLGCAPYHHEWETLVRAAESDGRMECSRD